MSGRPVVLVLRALGLGDFLTAVPALRALADAFPEHRRVLAAPAQLAPLVDLAGPVVELLPVPAFAARRPDSAALGHFASPDSPPPALAVNLHGRGPQSSRLLLGTRPGRLMAFACPEVPATSGGPAWREEEHEVARWCRLLSECGVAADPSRLDLPPPAAARGCEAGTTVIHPGAASPARRWPVERWAAVAQHEAASGRAVRISGGPDEVALASDLARRAGLPDSSVLAGRTDLAALAGVVAAAARVLCADTGVAHLATALGTPSVVLFGPVSPERWGPPPDRPQHRALWAGRTGDPHGLRPDPGLLGISVDEVLAAVSDLPHAHVRPRRPAEPLTGNPR